MLAGCLDWLVGRGPKAGVAGKSAYPIQRHQERKLHRAGPSPAHQFCSKPMLCIVPSQALFAPVSSCSGLSRNGMMLRPVRGQLELAAEGVQFLGLLEEGSATH